VSNEVKEIADYRMKVRSNEKLGREDFRKEATSQLSIYRGDLDPLNRKQGFRAGSRSTTFSDGR